MFKSVLGVSLSERVECFLLIIRCNRLAFANAASVDDERGFPRTMLQEEENLLVLLLTEIIAGLLNGHVCQPLGNDATLGR